MASQCPKLLLRDKLAMFVGEHGGMKQRDDSWYKSMGTTIGGSEIAAILGMNPYSSFDDIVSSKVAHLSGKNTWNGNEACWWGVLFEDVICAYTSKYLDAEIVGDEICIQKYEGHRFSPDGLAVADFFRNSAGELCIRAATATDIASEPQIILLEFKCPLRRRPTFEVPKQYLPQVLSGLNVTPATTGLFVDAVFRLCSYTVFNFGSKINTSYHYTEKDTSRIPAAIGMIGVYALNDDDSVSSQLACRIIREEPSAKTIGGYLDIGGMTSAKIVNVLANIDNKNFTVFRSQPIMAGSTDETDLAAKTLANLVENTPAGYFLIGTISWKLVDVFMIPVEKKEHFMDEVMPIISKVHAKVRDILSATQSNP